MSATKIENNTVVSIHYTLTSGTGDVIDSSEGEDPLALLWGAGQVVPGLESALAGRTSGDKFQVVVQPTDGYGDRTTEGPRAVPRDAFPDGVDLEEGMCFDVEDDEGNTETFWVSEVGEDEVHIDADHPLAGVTLHFDIEVVSIRPATTEEIAHGHAHDHDHDHGHQH